MQNRFRSGRAALPCSLAVAIAACPGAQAAALPSIDTRMGEQVVSIPASVDGSDVDLQTTIFKPPGDGPFPVLFMNHGKSPGDAHQQARARFVYISREFVKRGYAVVIPMRMGFAQSGGMYSDRACNLENNGEHEVASLNFAMAYVMKQPWADPGHMLTIWLPEVERFLKRVDMPTEIHYALATPDAPPRTDFAALGDVNAPPYLRSKGREGYAAFLEKLVPRAFALSPSGAWGSAQDGDDPGARALANCQKNSRAPCKLYAIDDDVVWKE